MTLIAPVKVEPAHVVAGGGVCTSRVKSGPLLGGYSLINLFLEKDLDCSVW